MTAKIKENPCRKINRAVRAAYRAADFFRAAHHNALHQGLAAHRGTIDLSYSDVTTHWYNKVPLVRGVCNMVENLMNGYKYLMHSADIALTEEEKEEEKQNESKLDRWLDEHAGPKVQSALMTLSACAGVVLAIFLFTFLPTFLTGLVAKVIPMGRWPRVI